MYKILAVTALGSMLAGTASAMPSAQPIPSVSAVQAADWYCGPHCWQHRQWHSNPYHYYGNPYRPYRYGYSYRPYRYGYYGY